MTRARATALALVNWKGVFYERYLLDRHVTVLEGANGAGKTTVMIAAYVVLLPDLTRLRFTNLGESGATGGDRGIYGRLGEAGRPSYAAMEIERGGERVVAGVRLERKAEPTLELTPFLITGVDLGSRLRDVLLRSAGEHDEVPDFSDIRAAITERGGALTIFPSAKEYFATLFDRGLTPLRLTTDEERQKMNDMLRTSMTGGISRALTTELRSFLFKEETGLYDTLGRMRKNLDACHRTRTEVGESRELEREIRGVFEAAEEMSTCSVAAAHARARELEVRATTARETRDARARDVRDLERGLADLKVAREGVSERLERARGAALEARARHAVAARAEELSEKRAELAGAHATAAAQVAATLEARDRASAERQAKREARDAAREAYDRAAYGVGNLQAGLDEIHKQVHARRVATKRLSEVRAALDRPSLDEPDIDAALAAARDRIAEIDAERARAERAARSSVETRVRWEEAFRALARVDPEATREAAFERARALETRAAHLEVVAGRLGDLGAARARHADLAERQARARERVAPLGLALDAGAAPHEPASARIGRAIEEAEADARRAELSSREHERKAHEARRAVAALRTEIDAATAAVPRHARIREHADAVAAHVGAPVTTRGRAFDVRLSIAEDIERQRARIAEARARQEDLTRKAAEIEAAGGAFHPDLLRLRDELDAELLAGRFDELDPARAAQLEAELGSLASALVVDDPLAAARALRGAPRELSEVWLIRPDAPILHRASEGTVPGGDVVIEETFGVRVARMPERPSIGRIARERRAAELRALAEEAGVEIEAGLERLKALEVVAEHAAELVADAPLLEAEPPAVVAERLAARSAALEEEAARATELFEAAEAEALAARSRGAALRALLGEAFLLDPPDHAEEGQRVEAELAAARAAREELRRTEADRALVRERLEVLGEVPIGEEEVELLSARRTALDEARDRAFALETALEDLAQHRSALGAPDRSGELDSQAALAPVLAAQLDDARAVLAEREQALTAAEATRETAWSAWQSATAAAEALVARIAQVDVELGELGLMESAKEARAIAERAIQATEQERQRLEGEAQRYSMEVAQLEERRAHAKRALEEAEVQLAEREREERPLRAAWSDVEARAARRFAAITQYEGRDADRLAADAKSRAQVLVERARRAKGGAACGEEIERLLATAEAGAGLDARAYLDAFDVARGFVAQRLPAQIAEAGDPALGLSRLSDHLELLEKRLERQEGDLRGASEDVARGIDVRLSRAKAQIRRLNQSLTGVHFGNIAAIRVEMRRIERMDAVLRALRQGDVQELLFQTNLPIEEALDEIFRRYGGGKTGGQKILDYREYAELVVEVQRSADKDWEPASPTRLSTGEAIGVGAALMMVVLTEWERDGNLLRPQTPAGGSLRFLFLDEANRLSQDNLGVLFSLCENLDLQLLIAAPEVARAEGNTTYRLVRRVDDAGREEVIVSGRRVPHRAPPEAALAPEPAPVAVEEAQPSLLSIDD